MVEQVTFQTVFQFLQTVGILVGVFYYITSLRNQDRSRQIQIIRGVSSESHSWGFLSWEFDDYDDFVSRHGQETDPEGYDDFLTWFNKMEEYGVYVREGLLDVRLVCLFSGGTMRRSWEKYRDIVYEERRRLGAPRRFIEAEFLYEKIVEYGISHPELEI